MSTNLHWVKITLLVSVTSIASCSKDQKDKSNPMPEQSSGSSQNTPKTSSGDSSTSNEYANQYLPSINVDSETLKNDLVDQSLVSFFDLFNSNTSNSNTNNAAAIRTELQSKGVTALNSNEFRSHSPAKVNLGKSLFYDRILSGNMTVSCATCHVVWRGTGDGTSLMNTVGFKGLFSQIDKPKNENLLPRNTPPLFNRGHQSFTNLFWDGRVEKDASMPSGHRSPAGAQLPEGLESTMAVQALFPLTSPEEMLGRTTDNGLAASNLEPKDIWAALMKRIQKNQTYMNMLKDAYPGVPESAFNITHIANALAAFEDVAFRADASSFDKFLAGDNNAMSVKALQGAQIFYGRALCSTCHSGNLQTDQKFHAIAVAQFGIGKGHGVNNREDFGRGGVTQNTADRYKFKTPSLRNVFITGPWGHNGAFADLRSYIRHYSNPAQSLKTWSPAQVILRTNIWPTGFFDPFSNQQIQSNILAGNEFPGVTLSQEDIEWIVEFLGTLTDRTYLTRDVVPNSVPSGMSDFLGVYGLKPEWFQTLRNVPWL